ncbi:MAG: hypothetical protein HYW07_20665 [Candidatus Latescibacteria bacterium]|nr:hypothetical protein [Candidatus Latescibacterota bacterium]
MRAAILLLGLCSLLACEPVDQSTGTTAHDDFELSVEVADRLIHVGDQTLLTLKLKRVDQSNLARGLQAVIVITTSVHGVVNTPEVLVSVPDEQTAELVYNVVFTARQPGIAEVRASFRDATALVKVLISSVNS